jgi:hypothetical protein
VNREWTRVRPWTSRPFALYLNLSAVQFIENPYWLYTSHGLWRLGSEVRRRSDLNSRGAVI